MAESNTFMKFSDVKVGDSFMYGTNIYIRIQACEVTTLDDGRVTPANVINLRTGKFGKFCGGTNVVRLSQLKAAFVFTN